MPKTPPDERAQYPAAAVVAVAAAQSVIGAPSVELGPATPISEAGIRAFFEGLAAIEPALIRSRPGRVSVAITPSLAGLVQQFCGTDPRYARVMANTWVQDYLDFKSA